MRRSNPSDACDESAMTSIHPLSADSLTMTPSFCWKVENFERGNSLVKMSTIFVYLFFCSDREKTDSTFQQILSNEVVLHLDVLRPCMKHKVLCYTNCTIIAAL